MFVNSKEELINYFHSGAKKDLFIGVEMKSFYLINLLIQEPLIQK